MVLDLRMPTVAARLLKVCWSCTGLGPGERGLIAVLQTWLIVDWSEDRAARLGVLVTSRATEIKNQNRSR